ncbi:MAG: tetratricopeptide repeat protein [Sedimentisphaerales bacterium]|nr:tetratricopeptide repeat protein [Sedimentisphaerales bacterium]
MRPTARLCFCVLLLAAGVLAGCAPSASRQGKAQLSLARQQYEDQKLTLAVHTLTEFLRRESRSREAAEALYLRGLCYRDREPPKYDLAEQDFQAALDKKPDASVRAWAHVALAHIAYETRPASPDQAVQHYQAALGDLPDEPPKDAVLFRLGSALQRQGQWQQADVVLSRCFDSFKDSQYAGYARRAFGARIWRIQFGAFSQMDRAHQLIEELRPEGWTADWHPRRENGQMLYIVRAGRYPTYAEAQADYARARQAHPEALLQAVAAAKELP